MRLTEVNEHNNGHNQNGENGEGLEGEENAPVAPSVAVLLVATADVIMAGLPEPVWVDVTQGAGLDVKVAGHADLSAWRRVLGLRRWPWSSQPYVSGGTLCRLTNLHGRWRDAKVRLHCCEPVDAIGVLRGEEDPSW